jgi:hypothetical protein
MLGGCGGGATAVPFANFLGTWQFQSGSAVMATCPGPVGNSTTAQIGNLHVEPAATGGDLVSVDPAGCDVIFKVTDTIATGVGNLDCPGRPGPAMGVTQDTTLTTITLTTTDGKTMTGASAGSAVFTSAAGMLTCTFTGTSTLVKVSVD